MVLPKDCMDYAYIGSLMCYKPDSQTIIWMRPQEFLDKAGDLPKGKPYKDIEELKDKMEKGIEIDPLYLDLDIKECKIVDHEGRHRALAAKELNISRVPVIVFHREGRYHVDLRDLENCSCNVFKAEKQSRK